MTRASSEVEVAKRRTLLPVGEEGSEGRRSYVDPVASLMADASSHL